MSDVEIDLLDPKTVKGDVILLGEGDFSFTRSLELYFGSNSKPRMISSSFDSGEEIAKKYKDANVWLSKWRMGGGGSSAIQALHGIDATKELLTQLGPAAADCTFSTVIFNFPHLGVEDARLHGAMVAHVMMRARELLLGSGGSGKGFFVLALADAQAERWKVNDMAIRNNMPLFKQFTFRPNDWPGYKIRRHINGKSFEKKVQCCSFFCYAVEGDTGEGNAVIGLLERILHSEEGACLPQMTQAQPKEDGPERNVVKEDHGDKREMEKMKKNTAQKPLKGKRKVQAMAEGHWLGRKPTTQEIEDGSAWPGHKIYACLLCQADGMARLFKSEESVADHVYIRHLREDTKRSTGGDTEGKERTGEKERGDDEATCPLQCPLCEKRAKNRAGLDYHMQAVHGHYGVLKPSWAANANTGPGNSERSQGTPRHGEGAVPDPRYECDVCGMRFSDDLKLAKHKEAGFQPMEDTQLTLPCALCDKRFKDQRALYQHMNVCQGRR